MSFAHGLPSMACPHCREPSQIRTSREVSPTLREIYYACRDTVGCGHTFRAELAVTLTLSPSARPDPRVQLRVLDRRVRAPANDNGHPAAATG